MSASERNEARVRLAEILVCAGLNAYKCAQAVGFPHCTGIIWETERGLNFGYKPDDDFRLRFRLGDRPAGSGGGLPLPFKGADKRRNVGWYDSAVFILNEVNAKTHTNGKRNSAKLLLVGLTEILVDTFDGWAGGWHSHPWRITFSFSDGSTVALSGGQSLDGTAIEPAPSPQPPDYYTTGPHFISYYQNGSCVCPPANGWRFPDFWRPVRPLVALPQNPKNPLTS
jgi:hypothetical protein